MSLKANIYIKNFRVCIAGFSVSTIARVGQNAPDPSSLPTFTSGGSLRWMSPELLDPSRLEDRDPRPTKESDCFALGMVIYEVRVGPLIPRLQLFTTLAGVIWTGAVRWVGNRKNQRCNSARGSTI